MRRVWVLLLCAYLLGWVPLNFANELFATVPSLQMRGAPAIIELALHGMAAMLCATAGWMLWVGAPAGLTLAAAAVTAAGLVSLQSLFFTVLPRNTAPGERIPLALVTCAHTAFWLAIIVRAARRERSRGQHDLANHPS